MNPMSTIAHPKPSIATTLEQTEAADMIPRLQNGDHLDRHEFLRRYHAMPDCDHAELIEGRVYMPSPVSADGHGEPHLTFSTWLGTYKAYTPGVIAGDNSTVNLDSHNAPQPDNYLRIEEACGGQCRLIDGYLHGAPELVAETSASSVNYDSHDKLAAYQRAGVREYIIHRTLDRQVDWFALQTGHFMRMDLQSDGIHKSRMFPGLWLDPAALVAGQTRRVLEVLQAGLDTQEHKAFVQQLSSRRS